MTIKHVQSSTTTVSEIERTTMKRVALRIVPFLMLCFLINFIDRINVGMAALTMNHDIGLMQTELAFGVSLFFVAYVTFGVPSNLALERVGARRWLALIMVGWGVVSMATAFIVGTKSFYVNRFLLGLTEAGFLPGSILFMSYWFPSSYRAKMISIFAMAMPISGFVGSPISGLLLGMHGVLGLKGWQWLFLLEGAPAPVFEALAFILLGKLYRKTVPRLYAHRYRLYLNRRDMRRQANLVKQIRGRKFVSGPQGDFYNLAEVFEKLNQEFFDGLLGCPQLGWSRRPSRGMLGHFDTAHNAIIISRIFDRADVPELALNYVMFHEMLHLQHPVDHSRARRRVHTREFREAEKKFPQFQEAKEMLKRL